MKVAVERTGGLVVLAESFGHSVFKDSFKRIFEDGEQSLGLCFNGTLEINCSKDIKIQGIIGPCTSMEKKGPNAADTVLGEGNTTAWKMCGLDKSTCLTVFFDLSSSERSNPPGTANPQLYIQFLTRFVKEFLNVDDDEVDDDVDDDDDDDEGMPNTEDARLLENTGWSSRTRSLQANKLTGKIPEVIGLMQALAVLFNHYQG